MLYLTSKSDFRILKKHLLKFYKNGIFYIEKSDKYYKLLYSEEPDTDLLIKFESVLLLREIIDSEYVYVFSSTIDPKKEFSINGCVNVLHNRPDRRYNFLKVNPPEYMRPPADIDAWVFIGKNCMWKEKVSGKYVSMGAMIFHELYECYYIVDKFLQPMTAHDHAVNMEKLLLVKLSKFDINPEKFTEGSLGNLLIKVDPFFS